MNILSRLFGPSRPNPAHSQLHSLPSMQSLEASQMATRRELLRVVLRDTLSKHGIPVAWISAETLIAKGRGREPGMHLRLLVKHWDPRLLQHGVAFEKSLNKRISLFDPLSHNWLMGVSWQFALADSKACPDMPDPTIWTSAEKASRPEPTTRRLVVVPSTYEATEPAELNSRM